MLAHPAARLRMAVRIRICLFIVFIYHLSSLLIRICVGVGIGVSRKVQHLFQQFHCRFVGGVVGAQLAAEGAGEDGFFHQVDLVEDSFGSFFGLLLFMDYIIEDELTESMEKAIQQISH